MWYQKFRIQNFKGIRDTEVRLSHNQDARVYTFVGLNESGKTTLLEAIHTFSPDADTQIIVGTALTIEEQRDQRVPRHRVSDFTGAVSITATIGVEESDRVELRKRLAKVGIDMDLNVIKDTFDFTRSQNYKNGDFVNTTRNMSFVGKVRTGRQGKYRDYGLSERNQIYDVIEGMVPVIAYFPTFVFNFPDRIYLTNRNITRVNLFYRKLFQDILDYDGRGHTIQANIISRIRKPELKGLWSLFFPAFKGANEEEKIQQVVDRAASAVTNVVFRKWNEIFGEKTAGKEVDILWSLEQGADKKNEKGVEIENDEHDIYIQFRIKDGVNRYNIKDRSLGFRWFFSFLLFTQFRVARNDGRATVFLFDEPASNLHAAAQQKLIESFPDIAKPPHSLIYSTHSHYMIEPAWLEQAFIVENGVYESNKDVMASALVDDESINIRATPYRKFVNENPSKSSYFQPILDRLDIAPSKFDYRAGGVFVEGKSDFYILKYIFDILLKDGFPIFPAVGAGTMGALISLSRGWGLQIRILLDGDKKGREEKKRYMKDFFLSEREIFTLAEICTGISTIEDAISDEDKDKIGREMNRNGPASKSDLLTFFQEKLASKKKVKFSSETLQKVKLLRSAIRLNFGI